MKKKFYLREREFTFLFPITLNHHLVAFHQLILNIQYSMVSHYTTDTNHNVLRLSQSRTDVKEGSKEGKYEGISLWAFELSEGQYIQGK